MSVINILIIPGITRSQSIYTACLHCIPSPRTHIFPPSIVSNHRIYRLGPQEQYHLFLDTISKMNNIKLIIHFILFQTKGLCMYTLIYSEEDNQRYLYCLCIQLYDELIFVQLNQDSLFVLTAALLSTV